MNRLTGQLLHACFEQGPFEHENLIRACRAWPQLARYYLASRTKVQGYEMGPIEIVSSTDKLPCVRSWQRATNCGIDWLSYVMYLGQGTYSNSLILNFMENNEVKVAQIDFHVVARQIRPQSLNHESLMKWMCTNGSNGLVRIWYHGWSSSDEFTLTVSLRQFMGSNFCLATDHRTARAFEHLARIHRDMSREIDPLFEVVARLAWHNQPK